MITIIIMKKIALTFAALLMSFSAQAHLPVVKKIGHGDIGFYPLCSNFQTGERTIQIPEETSKLFLQQYMGYSWDKASLFQAVDVVLTSTVKKYPKDDQPALGIYERTLGEFGYFSYQHQYNQYVLLDNVLQNQVTPCWFKITDIEYHSDICEVTGN